MVSGWISWGSGVRNRERTFFDAGAQVRQVFPLQTITEPIHAVLNDGRMQGNLGLE